MTLFKVLSFRTPRSAENRLENILINSSEKAHSASSTSDSCMYVGPLKDTTTHLSDVSAGTKTMTAFSFVLYKILDIL